MVNTEQIALRLFEVIQNTSQTYPQNHPGKLEIFKYKAFEIG